VRYGGAPSSIWFELDSLDVTSDGLDKKGKGILSRESLEKEKEDTGAAECQRKGGVLGARFEELRGEKQRGCKRSHGSSDHARYELEYECLV